MGENDESQDNYDDDDFEDYDDDFEDDEEEDKPPTPKRPPQPAPAPPPAPAPVPAPKPPKPEPTHSEPLAERPPQLTKAPVPTGALRGRRMSEEEIVAKAIASENERSKLASREGGSRRSSLLLDENSRPGQMRERSSSFMERVLPERKSVGLPSKEKLVQDKVLTDEDKLATRARLERWKKINKLVKIRPVAFDDVFSLAPLTLRELCDLGRGAYANHLVKGTQTNEDARTLDTQTDDVEVRKVAAQCPEDLGLSRDVLEKSADASKRKTKSLPGWTSTAGVLGNDHARRLNKFVGHFGPIIESLLNERLKKEVTIFDKAPRAGASNPLAEAELTLDAAALVSGRRVTSAAYSSDPRVSLLLTAYAPSEAGMHEHGEAGRGLLLVWDLTKPQAPIHILTSEGTPTCCCWSPNQPFCAIAGMEEGGICLWDVREPEREHPEEGGVVRRRPTYTTEFACELEDIVGPIVALSVSTSKSAGSEASRLSFQLVSLDAWANVVVWLVMEMSNADIAGADVDFGLRIGGRVKMLRTSVVTEYGPAHAMPLVLPAAGIAAPAGAQDKGALAGAVMGMPKGRVRNTYHLAIFPCAQNEFLVAGDQGMVLRGIRFGVTPVPRQYALSDPALGSRFSGRYLSHCASISFSPFFPTFFLAAYCPATIALYTVDVGLALLMWRDFTIADLVCVRWSPAKPSLFFVLDTRSTIYAFELLGTNITTPVLQYQFAVEGSRVTCFEVSLSTTAIAEVLGEADMSKLEHSFVLTYSSGRVTVAKFSEDFVSAQPAGSGGLDRFVKSMPYKATAALLEKFHQQGVAGSTPNSDDYEDEM